MILNILDPLNINNNIGKSKLNLGKNAKAFELQNMFRASYIALHTNINGNKLPFMFDVKNIMLSHNYWRKDEIAQ
jgi:hypothetical protein